MTALESATAGWSNVLSQTYTAGTTRLFSGLSGVTYTGCSAVVANTCTSNTYTLASRTAATGSTTAWQISSTGQIVKYAPVTYTDNGVRAVVAVTKGYN